MTSDFVIRVAETGDVPQMQAIAHDAYNVYVEKMGRDPAPMHAD
ncbi:MAG TPA: GNAT family N-acetyltransferase, partial [Alphaproteobacteria bacterium]|nr:GNAT family N-acetyltransferase [Alphaproteobacteria bacterium]